MTITFADAGEATSFLVARDTDAKAYRKLTREVLASLAVQRGLYGDLPKWSKDDLIGTLLDADFPIEAVNLAIHVRTHTQRFPDCEHCQNAARAEANTAWRQSGGVREQTKLAEDTFALIDRSTS